MGKTTSTRLVASAFQSASTPASPNSQLVRRPVLGQRFQPRTAAGTSVRQPSGVVKNPAHGKRFQQVATAPQAASPPVPAPPAQLRSPSVEPRSLNSSVDAGHRRTASSTRY